MEMTEITISLIKADVGGFPGHSAVHPALIETAEKKLEEAKKSGAMIDFRVLSCGDDLELLMSHKKGCDSGEVHALAWETSRRPPRWLRSSSSTEQGRTF